MIDRLFVRPLLAVFTFVKRNPLLALLLLALLFILPPLLGAIRLGVSFAINVVQAVLGVKAAQKFAELMTKVVQWMEQTHWLCPMLAIAIGIFSPLVGGLLTAWCIVDKFKTGPTLTVLPTPSVIPDTPPDIDPDTSDTRSIDDILSGNDPMWS